MNSVAAAGSAQLHLRSIGGCSVWSIHARQARGRGRRARRASAGSAGNWKSALALGSGKTKLAWRVAGGGIWRSFCAEGAQRGRLREVGSHSNVHQGFELRS
jgi:hypothetical protein